MPTLYVQRFHTGSASGRVLYSNLFLDDDPLVFGGLLGQSKEISTDFSLELLPRHDVEPALGWGEELSSGRLVLHLILAFLNIITVLFVSRKNIDLKNIFFKNDRLFRLK